MGALVDIFGEMCRKNNFYIPLYGMGRPTMEEIKYTFTKKKWQFVDVKIKHHPQQWSCRELDKQEWSWNNKFYYFLI